MGRIPRATVHPCVCTRRGGALGQLRTAENSRPTPALARKSVTRLPHCPRNSNVCSQTHKKAAFARVLSLAVPRLTGTIDKVHAAYGALQEFRLGRSGLLPKSLARIQAGQQKGQIYEKSRFIAGAGGQRDGFLGYGRRHGNQGTAARAGA